MRGSGPPEEEAAALLGHEDEPEGFEALLGTVQGLIEPLDPFVAAAERFRSLRRRPRRSDQSTSLLPSTRTAPCSPSFLCSATWSALDLIADEVVACRACPRLVAWREQVAREKVARFADQTYWGRPVPGFGDPAATRR